MANQRPRQKIAGDYYMYGRHPVIAALNNPERKIKKLLCTRDVFSLHESLIGKHPHEIVTNHQLDIILRDTTQAVHQGITALTASIFTSNIAELNSSKPDRHVVILDRVTDPHNIGAIIRSICAFAVDALIMPQDHSPDESGALAKSACGALEMVKIIKVTNLKSAMEYLKSQGFWLIGFDGAARETLGPALFRHNISGHNTSPMAKIALIFGSEEKGMRRLTRETCDHIVKIPMSGNSQSINVSNAAAIACYMMFSATN